MTSQRPPPPSAKRKKGLSFFPVLVSQREHTIMPPSNGEAALDETQGYEMFKENKFEEAQQVMDDLDDFERRLQGGVPMAKPAAKAAMAPPARAAAPKPGAKKAGSEYVKASCVAKSEEEVEADDARKAVSDLDKFDQMWG